MRVDFAEALHATEERRLHRYSWWFVTLGIFWQWIWLLATPFLINLFSGKGKAPTLLWVIAALIAVLFICCLLYSLLFCRSYRFVVRDGTLFIRYGVVLYQGRSVPLDKVHNVTLTRSFTHRLLGVAEVTLETGGSGETAEARLRVLSLADARLFEELTLREKPADEADDNLLPLDNRALLRYGLLNDFGLFLGAMFALLALFPDEKSTDWFVILTQGLFKLLLPDDWYHSGASWLLVLVLSLLLGKLTIVIGAFFRYSHFYLGESDGLLTQRRGLFSRVESHMPLDRIQVWRVRQGPLYRLCGLFSVTVDTVVVPGKQGERGISELLPLADAATVSRLLARWAGCDPFAVPLHPVHPQAAQRAFRVKALLLAIGIAVAVFFAWLSGAQRWQIALPLMWLASLLFLRFANVCRYRYTAWTLAHGFLHWRSGWLWRKHCFVAVDKVQALQLTESPFDRRYGMANLAADTMGAGITAPFSLSWLAKEDAVSLLHGLTDTLKTHD